MKKEAPPKPSSTPSGSKSYYLGVDKASPNGDHAAWCLLEHNTRTGRFQIIQQGSGPPPQKQLEKSFRIKRIP